MTHELKAGIEKTPKTVRLECRLCGCQLTIHLQFHGRLQGPLCQCNPNYWGYWRVAADRIARLGK